MQKYMIMLVEPNVGDGHMNAFVSPEVHVNEALCMAELVDIETGEPIEEPNKPGKLIMTF